jgi:hypothetical protein
MDAPLVTCDEPYEPVPSEGLSTGGFDPLPEQLRLAAILVVWIAQNI